MKLKSAFVLFFATFQCASAEYQLTRVSEGWYIPWGLQFIDKDTLVVTEKNGLISQLDLKSKQRTALFEVPNLDDGGQGGLLDVAQSPINPKQLYFTYSKETDSGSATTLASATLNANQLTNWQDMLVTSAQSDTGRHFGSRITFDDDGHLFLSLGDRGERDNGQNTNNQAATILRLNLDGTIPSDNPFTNENDVDNAI